MDQNNIISQLQDIMANAEHDSIRETIAQVCGISDMTDEQEQTIAAYEAEYLRVLRETSAMYPEDDGDSVNQLWQIMDQHVADTAAELVDQLQREAQYTTCDICGARLHIDEAWSDDAMTYSKLYCETCAGEHLTNCDDCGGYIDKRDAINDDGRELCPRCYERREDIRAELARSLVYHDKDENISRTQSKSGTRGNRLAIRLYES